MKVQVLKCINRGFAPVGKLIQLQQGTNFSHFAIGFQSMTGEYLVVDATSKNVAIRHVHHFLKQYEVVETSTIDLVFSYEDFFSWLEPLLGEKYGFKQLIGILIKSKRLGGGVICNELVLRMLMRFTKYVDTDIDIRDLNYTSQIVDTYKM